MNNPLQELANAAYDAARKAIGNEPVALMVVVSDGNGAFRITYPSAMSIDLAISSCFRAATELHLGTSLNRMSRTETPSPPPSPPEPAGPQGPSDGGSVH